MTPENQPEVVLSDREKYHIPSDVIIDDFEEHLSIPNNLRIFFSAKFGTGKSYFLEEFFRDKNKEYEVIKLYPINYSTASNNDIFELIKFDILFHLMRFHEDKFDNLEISKFIAFQWFLKGKTNLNATNFYGEVMSTIVDSSFVMDSLSLSATIVPTLYKVFKQARTEFEAYRKETLNNELNFSDGYLEKILKGQHEYGDENPIVVIIKNIIQRIGKSTLNKQTVLLIDDLDRLDPEHIFRILNIFGNHFSFSSGNKFYVNENKFGFDKVILVGDTKNIKGIFHHKYGLGTDFNGYFSKYFSRKIYNFSIVDILTSNFDKLITDFVLPVYSDDFRPEIVTVKECIKIVLRHIVSQDEINFRQLNKKRKDIPKLGDLMPVVYGEVQNSIPYRMTEYFIEFFEGKKVFVEILNNLSDFEMNSKNFADRYWKFLFGELIFFLIFDIRNPSQSNRYNQEFLKIQEFHIISFLKNEYRLAFYVRAQDNYPTIDLNQLYSSREDLEKRVNKIDPEQLSISFLDIYLKFLDKYF